MQDRIDAGEYVRPCDGETLSGDAALVQWDDDDLLVAVIDVLGLGPDAHELAIQLSGILSKWLTAAAAPSPEQARPQQSAYPCRRGVGQVRHHRAFQVPGSLTALPIRHDRSGCGSPQRARVGNISGASTSLDFHCWHQADVQTALMNVRFEGHIGHDADGTRCLLLTLNGHATRSAN